MLEDKEQMWFFFYSKTKKRYNPEKAEFSPLCKSLEGIQMLLAQRGSNTKSSLSLRKLLSTCLNLCLLLMPGLWTGFALNFVIIKYTVIFFSDTYKMYLSWAPLYITGLALTRSSKKKLWSSGEGHVHQFQGKWRIILYSCFSGY